MSRIIGVLFIFIGCFSAFAQNDQKLKISNVKIGDGLYDFFAENPNVYPMQLELKFTEFANMEANCDLPYVAIIQPGKTKIFTVKRTLIDLPGAFKYDFTTRIGAYPVHPDRKAICQLPIENGKSTTVIAYDFTGSRSPEKIVWGFGMNKGDVVYSCRDGVVCQLSEVQMRDSMRIGDNTVTILHPDQTFGKYELLADNSFMVQLGDTISVGRAIGTVGVTKFTKVPSVRYSVYFVNARIDSINANRLRNIHTYLDPVFIDSKGKAFQLENGQTYFK